MSIWGLIQLKWQLAFESFVKEGQSLKVGTKLAKMNLDVIEQAAKKQRLLSPLQIATKWNK